jgi:MoaA/NifB/PqqE/SkfB family radical SAM enzyme
VECFLPGAHGTRGTGDLISADEFEEVFKKLYERSRRALFDIKTTEAQHYRRYVAQACAAEQRQSFAAAPAGARRVPEIPEVHAGTSPRQVKPGVTTRTSDGIGRAPRGINDAKGFVFVSHVGEVFPSGFLPLSAGNVRPQWLADIYQHSPLFGALHDTSRLKRKCGTCEFREISGGSRARAYALVGDPFAKEPCCVYQPKPRLFGA